MDGMKKVARWFVPGIERAEDGREKWPSRVAFILAGMGSAVGLGNLLRYPSVVFNHWGLQWFIPYLLALFFVGIPLLLLEIALGQSFRGGAVVALGRVHPRLRLLGFGAVYIAISIATYYSVILAWVMVFFRHSFQSPLPWEGRVTEFFLEEVIANEDSDTLPDGRVTYPGEGIVGETFGWSVFVWFLVVLCIFKGVSLTGRVVYVTMTLPIILVIALLARAVTLENARLGIELYIATWRSEKLADPAMWQAAVGQIFFSIGTGSGIFIAYASYNNVHQNAVQDTLIIALSNSLFEVVAGFAAFGVIGYLNLDLDRSLSTFTLGFLTYPEALAQIPGGPVWAVFFFLMLMLLGIDSAFSLAEAFITAIADAPFAQRIPRYLLVVIICFGAMMFGMLYTARGFGLNALDYVDKYTNELTLLFVPMCEAIAINTLYRWRDVAGQVGFPAFILFQSTYICGMLVGIIVAFQASIPAGVGTWLGIWFCGFLVSTIIGKTPVVGGPFGSTPLMAKFWWLAAYSGNQLRRDLNVHVATGKNWKIPTFWAPVLRWLTVPILLITVSFIFPQFATVTNDPVAIFGFCIGLLGALFGIIGFVVPTIGMLLLPDEEREHWREQYSTGPGETVMPAKLPKDFGDLSDEK